MFEAIHKPSKKRISTFQLTKDLEWQGKENDEFVAPTDMIDNWEELNKQGLREVKVAFVNQHKRYEGTDKEERVSAHFRIEDGRAVESRWASESEEHKLAKKYIYENIDKIMIAEKFKVDVPIISLGIADVRIEKGIGMKRADVLVDFNQWHPVYGKGIAFEIQISPQSEYETIERSYDRACYGYSICWIWSDELKTFSNKVTIIPYNLAVKEYQSQQIEKQDERYSQIALKVRRLDAEMMSDIQAQIRKWESLAEQQKLRANAVSQENNNIIAKIQALKSGSFDELKRQYDEVKEAVKIELEQMKAKVIADISANLSKEILARVQGINVEQVVRDYIEANVKREVTKGNLECPECGSKDTHEYLDMYMCFGCKRKIAKSRMIGGNYV